MAWSTPRQANIGDQYTAAWYNADTRDNLGQVWHELSYTEFTAPVTINQTVVASAVTIVTAPSFTATGTNKARLIFYSPLVESGTSVTSTLQLYLFINGSVAGAWTLVNGISNANPIGGAVYSVIEYTPSVGATVYSVRAIYSGTQWTVKAGAGGAGALVPGFLQILQLGG